MRNLTAALLLFAALVLQVSVVNPLFGRFAPDLVILVVLSLAVFRDPVAGAVIGFFGGLAYDLLPPSDHTLGQYALVLCALGYVSGRVGGQLPLVTVALCTVAAPALVLGVGALLGTPGATWETLRTAWPREALCDLIVLPAVLWAVGGLHQGRRRSGGTRLVTNWRRGTA
ncbi:hypothetical protein TBS_14700 [Thermobispora bispora]|uniref:rod shape-determining protein MreD n=1 Tax=Thermobispora bispora TaxID=2006 RepID=UPI0030E9F8AF